MFSKSPSLSLSWNEAPFDDFGISVSGLYEHATGEPNGGQGVPGAMAAGIEDLDIWYVGAKVDFAGFSVGANYTDLGDFVGPGPVGSNTGGLLSTAQTAAGQDGGDYWAVAAGYKQGPWGIGVFYSLGERDWGMNGSPSTGVEESVERWGIGGHYSVAPGW